MKPRLVKDLMSVVLHFHDGMICVLSAILLFAKPEAKLRDGLHRSLCVVVDVMSSYLFAAFGSPSSSPMCVRHE